MKKYTLWLLILLVGVFSSMDEAVSENDAEESFTCHDDCTHELDDFSELACVHLICTADSPAEFTATLIINGQEFARTKVCDKTPPTCTATFRNPHLWRNAEDFEGDDPLRCLLESYIDTTGVDGGGNIGEGLLAEVCDAAPISVGGCDEVPGVTPLPDAPGGNKRYLLPAAASGADFDYELVEIGNQCWFAENSREGTGQYFGGVANEPTDGAGLLYTYQEVMNGAPGERNQGVCPAGWHVPSDCEFMAMEGALGLPPEDQTDVWTDTHPQLWEQLREGGSSGFEQIATGYWDPTGGGWWGAPETQLHISGNAPGVGGALMKRYGSYDPSGSYYRFQGAPDSGYRFGLRCLYDGETVDGEELREGNPANAGGGDGDDTQCLLEPGSQQVIDPLEPIHGDICTFEVCDKSGNCSTCDSPELKFDDEPICTAEDGTLLKRPDGTCGGTCADDDDDCHCILGDASRCRDGGPINCYTNPFHDRCPGFQNPACLIDPFTPGCPVVNPCYPVVMPGAVCPKDAERFCARNPYHYGCNVACGSGAIDCDPMPPGTTP